MSKIKNLSLVGRLTINMASLNNEGSEGNATQPRSATIVDDGQLYSVPVISGDMLKYWHAENLSRIAQDRNLPLSDNANRRNPDPNRMKSELNKYDWVIANIEEAKELRGDIKGKDRQPLETALYREVAKACVLTDSHGLLITELSPKDKAGKPVFSAGVAVARTSRIQVGFMVGVPSKSATRHYFHTKFVSTRTGQQSRESGTNEGQNIFTRPATSADYAVVINIDLAGIGFDDAQNDYVISHEERIQRQRAVLDALSFTLLHQNGANVSQQFPHIMNFKGAIVTSDNRLPAPTISPIKSNYLEVLKDLIASAKSMNDNAKFKFIEINQLSDAVKVLTNIGKELSVK